MKAFWDQRYSASEYVYGTQPNAFFEDQIRKLTPGRILLPADGEGRNSIFAARLGWEVYANDISEEGQKKAKRLAEKMNVNIDYLIGDFGHLTYQPESFDAVALIFAHFPPEVRKTCLSLVKNYLKPGGVVIIEAFNKDHLNFNSVNPQAGGPKDAGMLYSLEELVQAFDGYSIIASNNAIRNFNEGQYHVGRGSVCQFVAQKPV